MNTILFVYNIGEIRNVPLSVVHDFGKINSNGVTKTHTETFKKSISQDCMDKYTNTVKKATTDSYSWTLAKEWSDSTTVNESWAKENSVTQEQINSYYKNQSNNWYVSSGSSGSDSITQSDSSSSSAMLSSVRNKKTDDKHSTSTETNVSANLDIKNTTTIGAKIPVDFVSISAENKTEIGLGLSASRTDKESTSSRVQTDNTDSATLSLHNPVMIPISFLLNIYCPFSRQMKLAICSISAFVLFIIRTPFREYSKTLIFCEKHP